METKKRLIDAHALMKAIRSFRWIGVPNTLKLMFDYLKIIINEQPTVDAVEVVRCKDCQYSGTDSCPTWYEDRMTYRDCWHLDGDNDFCSYGERRPDHG